MTKFGLNDIIRVEFQSTVLYFGLFYFQRRQNASRRRSLTYTTERHTRSIRGDITMEAIRDKYLYQQLVDRRERLGHALSHATNNRNLARLLQEVDAALERMDAGTYGICESCHETIESERLLLNPLVRNCIDHLSAEETRSLERVLDLAYQIQRALLPRTDVGIDGWDIAYHYEAAGPV